MFWLTVRSNINHQFKCLLHAQLLCTTKEAEGLLQSSTAKEGTIPISTGKMKKKDIVAQLSPPASQKPLVMRGLTNYVVIGEKIHRSCWYLSTFIEYSDRDVLVRSHSFHNILASDIKTCRLWR